MNTMVHSLYYSKAIHVLLTELSPITKHDITITGYRYAGDYKLFWALVAGEGKKRFEVTFNTSNDSYTLEVFEVTRVMRGHLPKE